MIVRYGRLPLSGASSLPAPMMLDGLMDDPETGAFARIGVALYAFSPLADGVVFHWHTLQQPDLAVGIEFCPGPELDGQDIYLEARLGRNSWQSSAVPLRLTPPQTVLDPDPEVFEQGDEVDILPMARFFSGQNLVYSSPDTYRIDPISGLLEVPTDTPVENGIIRVRAVNSGGMAELALPYHVEAGPDHCLWFGARTLPGHGACALPRQARALRNNHQTGLVVANAGVVVGPRGPSAGALKFDTGLRWQVQVASREYSVASAAEAQTALKQARSGETVRLRSSVRALSLNLRGLKSSGVILTGEPGHSIERIELDNCVGLSLSGLDFRHDNSAGGWFKAGDTNYVCVLRNCRGVVIEDCHFDCDPRQTGGKQDLNSLMKRFGAIRASGSVVEVSRCRIIRARDGVVVNDGQAYIHHCNFRQIFEDAITGLHTDWQVDDNDATLFEATYVRDFPGTLSGNLAVGAALRTADGANALEVVRLEGGVLRARVNNYNLPVAGQVFKDKVGNSFTVRGKGKEAPGLNLHGNFFQPILLKDSRRNYQVVVRRNVVYRSTPYSRGAVAQEPNTEGMRIQRNGGGHLHAPVEITHNIIATGQPAGIHCFFCADGLIANNTVLWGEMGYRSDIEIRNGRNLRVERNAGDDNQDDGVDDKGGNVNTRIAGNFRARGRDQKKIYNAPYTYPQTRKGLAPRSGSALDLSGAGALKPDGNFRD